MNPVLVLLLKSRPFRRLFWVVAVTSMLAWGVVTWASSLSPTPEQEAAAEFGSATGMAMPRTEQLEPGHAVDPAVAEELVAAGASDAVTFLSRRSMGLTSDEGHRIEVHFSEMAAPSFATDGVFRLVDGRWPQRAREVIVHERSGISLGAVLRPGAGQMPLTVVGVGERVMDRSSAFVLAAPGTWASWTVAEGELAPTIAAGVGALYRADPGVTLPPSTPSIASIEPLLVRDLFWLRVLLLSLPTIAAAGAAAFAMAALIVRRLRRVLVVCHRLGIQQSRLRAHTTVAVSVATLLGFLAGAVLGCAAGAVAQGATSAQNDRLSAPYSIPWLSLLVATATTVGLAVVGARVGNLVFRTSRRSDHQGLRPRLMITLMVVGVLLVGVGLTLQVLFSPNPRTMLDAARAAGALYALALIVWMGPLLHWCGGVLGRGVSAGALAWRVLRRDALRHGIALGLVVLMASVVAITYAFATSGMLALVRSTLTNPPGVASVEVAGPGTDPRARESATRLARDHGLGKPVVSHSHECVETLSPIRAVRTVEEAEMLLGMRLTASAREAFHAGSIVTHHPYLHVSKTTVVDCRRHNNRKTVTVFHQSSPTTQGVTSPCAVRRLPPGAPPVSALEEWRYGGLTASQLEELRSWPLFHAQALTVLVPEEQAFGHVGISMLVMGVLTLILTLLIVSTALNAEVRRLRPPLAALRALGLPNSWTRRVVWHVAGVYAAVAGVGVVLVMAVTTVVADAWGAPHSIDLAGFPVGESLGLLAVLGLGTGLAAWLATRSLAARERLESED